MDSPERVRSCVERDVEGDVEVNIDIVRDDDNGDGYDKSKSRSNKSRKPGNMEEADVLDGSGRISTSDRHESLKRLSGSGKVAGEQDDYEARKELRKQVKKKSEENILDKLSTWYQDGEAENKFEGVDKYRSREHSRTEESEKKKPTSKYSEHNVDVEKGPVRDMQYSEKMDSGKERGHAYVEHGRSSRNRWDDTGNIGKTDDYVEESDIRIRNPSDHRTESAGEKIDTMEIQSIEIKSRVVESMNGKGIKSHDREERRVDTENSKRGRPEVPEQDCNRSLILDEKSSKESFEEHTQPRNRIQDIVDNSDMSLDADEDVSIRSKGRSRRDAEISNSSRTPEKTGKRQYESDEMDCERNTNIRRKEPGKDVSFDDRSKGRDDSWGDRNRDRDNLKDTWKRRQDKETRDGESTYGNRRDWEFQRRHDWSEGDNRFHGRSAGRKDGNRTEAVKTSSKYGISNENYDVIEIQTKPFDYAREDSRSIFAKNSEVIQQPDRKLAPEIEEFAHSRDDRSRSTHGSIQSGDAKDRFMDGGPSMQDQHSWRDDNDFRSVTSKGPTEFEGNRCVGGHISTNGPLPSYGNQEAGSYSRTASQGVRGNRIGRGGRGRPTGRDNQQAGIAMPIIGSPFGALGLPPPGPQSLGPNMSPASGPPMSPGVYIPSFQPLWPGARGVEMNMLAVPPGLPPVPPGPLGPRFPPNLGNQPNGPVFSPSGPGRGMPSSIPGPNFNAIVPMIRGQSQDKFSGGWVPPRSNVPPGKAPSRGEQNDYSQNFVDTGMRPQNFIRELELTSVVEDYPKLRELIQRKDEIVAKTATPPMYYKCDLREQVLSPEFFGTKFDVILVDPPWEEYVHRSPGVTDHMEHWTFEEIMNLKIEGIADTPSFVFLWVGDGVGLEQGRQCLKKWGFRRCEDICWVKTNKTNATPGLRHDSHTLYQRTKEHCLMGIKGTVRRSTDGHIIHANIDTDVIIAEEPPYGSTAKPEDMYRIIEHFVLGRRRLELFGEDHNIRSGWLTVGKELTSSNFNSEGYVRNFADKDGKVWVGGGGRNPPPEAPHLALTTPEIESLRPKSPMKNQQQQQAPSVAISLTAATSSNQRAMGNSPQHHMVGPTNQEASSSNMPSPAPWASSLMVREGGHTPGDDRFDMYASAYNTPFGPSAGNFFDYEEAYRGMNML